MFAFFLALLSSVGGLGLHSCKGTDQHTEANTSFAFHGTIRKLLLFCKAYCPHGPACKMLSHKVCSKVMHQQGMRRVKPLTSKRTCQRHPWHHSSYPKRMASTRGAASTLGSSFGMGCIPCLRIPGRVVNQALVSIKSEAPKGT